MDGTNNEKNLEELLKSIGIMIDSANKSLEASQKERASLNEILKKTDRLLGELNTNEGRRNTETATSTDKEGK